MMEKETENLKSLTEKLKTEGDISLKEADRIFSLLSANSTIAAVDDYNDRSAFFVEREKVSILRAVMDIPLEKLVKNALSRNVIDEKMAANILSDIVFLHWVTPVMKLAKASAEYVDDVIKLKMEWEAKKETIENEDEWLDHTR